MQKNAPWLKPDTQRAHSTAFSEQVSYEVQPFYDEEKVADAVRLHTTLDQQARELVLLDGTRVPFPQEVNTLTGISLTTGQRTYGRQHASAPVITFFFTRTSAF